MTGTSLDVQDDMDMFAWAESHKNDFQGDTFVPERDGVRLGEQLARVYGLVIDGKWRTLAQISETTGDPEASCSARIRDLRKPRFGLNVYVEREFVARGLFKYRVIPMSQAQT